MAKIIIGLILFTLMFSLEASTQKEVQRFYKCYAIMTQNRLAADSPLLQKVKDAKLSGTQACMQVLSSANLNNNLKINNPKSNLLGQKVLRSFQSFHSSWFSNYLTYMTDDSPILFDIVELNEPAFFLSKALFSRDEKYSDVLKGAKSYRGVRLSQATPDYLIGTGVDEKLPIKNKYKILRAAGKPELFWSPTHLSRGTLVGLEENKLGVDLLPAHGHQLFFPTFYDEPLDIHQSLGGGFMGTNSYLLFNNGRPHGERSDGQVIMFRSYSKYLLNDILCRDLPVITTKDAKPYTRLNKSVSWSNSESCMSCHATIDPMASLLRNAELVVNEVPEQGSSHLKFHRPKFSLPDTYKLYDEVADYYLSEPKGNFYYRDVNGKLFNKTVKSLDELGEQMAQTEDFYACAVSRYFYFLTGEEIPIVNLSQKSKKHKFLSMLASELRSHQRTQKIIKRIISSDWFLN